MAGPVLSDQLYAVSAGARGPALGRVPGRPLAPVTGGGDLAGHSGRTMSAAQAEHAAALAVQDFLRARGHARYTLQVVAAMNDQGTEPSEWLSTLTVFDEMQQLDGFIKSVDAQGRAQKLREVPLFSEIQDQKFLKRLAKELKPRSASAGTAIITVGEQDPNEMFFLRTGEVEVVVGTRVVATLGAGAYFGEAALMSSTVRNVRPPAAPLCPCSACACSALAAAAAGERGVPPWPAVFSL
jgi:hypothetical protein